MQMERDWINNGGGIGVGGHRLSSVFESPAPSSNFFQISSSPFPAYSPSPCSSSLSGGAGVPVGVGGVNYIEHPVSKFDTLAGVAIKYGVEVADIKKINGLVTDLQMFALKTLHIPLPGRHPPSPILANGIYTQSPRSPEQTPCRRRHSDLFDSFQSLKLTSSNKLKVSSAMNNLQGYYGLKPPDQQAAPGGCEMAIYGNGGSHYLEDGPLGKPLPHMNPPLSLHRKCKSVANDLKLDFDDQPNNKSVAVAGENESWISNLVRRRQKSEADFSRNPAKLLKHDNANIGGFLAIAAKGLALRSNATGRTVSVVADGEAGRQNLFPTANGDSSLIDSSSGVRKSSSTSSLQDSDDNNNNSSSSIWPTVNWSLKQDLQALSTAAIPKPVTSRKNKTAVD